MGVICIDIKLASFIVDLWDFFFFRAAPPKMCLDLQCYVTQVGV